MTITKDFISIEELQIPCRVGCTKEERAFPQIVTLDITIHAPLKKASTSDDIADTIDYAFVIEEIKKLLNRKEFQLLEHVVGKIIQDILEIRLVQAVGIKATKTVFSDAGKTGVYLWQEK